MAEKLTIEYIPIAEIIPYENNPRKNDKAVDIVMKSIKEFGFKNPIILDKDNKIIAGHTRIKAAVLLGLLEVPVIWADELTPEQVKAFRIMDNKSHEYSDWDIEPLKLELHELKTSNYNLKLTGFSDIELYKLIPDKIEEEKLPDLNKPKYDIKQGEIWQLGDHRLMCGDSTNKEHINRLINNQNIDMVFTDPPYGIGFKYNEYVDVKGDEYLIFCEKWFNILKEKSDLIIITTGWSYNKFWENKEPYDTLYWLAWNKMTGGKVSYLRKVEPVRIWGKFIKKLDLDIIEELTERNDLGDKHSCPKPTGLISRFINHGIEKNGLVLDIFGGSGTTLIVCENINRKCYMMEIDSKYCSVIIERWENLTGKKAERI